MVLSRGFVDYGVRPGRPYAFHRLDTRRVRPDGTPVPTYRTRGWSRIAEWSDPDTIRVTMLGDGLVRLYGTDGSRTDGGTPDPLDVRLVSALLYGPVCA